MTVLVWLVVTVLLGVWKPWLGWISLVFGLIILCTTNDNGRKQ